VVDTGVFLRWFVDQDGFEHARELQQKLLDGSTGSRAPAAMAARKNLGMYDALFVQLARELDLPLLTTDRSLQRAAEGSVRAEVLAGLTWSPILAMRRMLVVKFSGPDSPGGGASSLPLDPEAPRPGGLKPIFDYRG
jgi:hypothetical protein